MFEYNEIHCIKTDINVTDDEYINIKNVMTEAERKNQRTILKFSKMIHILAKKIRW